MNKMWLSSYSTVELIRCEQKRCLLVSVPLGGTPSSARNNHDPYSMPCVAFAVCVQRTSNDWFTMTTTSLLLYTLCIVSYAREYNSQGKLDPKKLQLQLTGFLEKSTGMFMEELWGLLLDAQNSLGGIPSAFLQEKKQEMLQAKVRS